MANIKEKFISVRDRWKRVPLRWKGRISIILPLTAVLISSTFALFGNHKRQEIENDIRRKFALVSGYNEILTATVNAETGVRGYQLTRRPEFLQPYETARQNLSEKIGTVETLIEAEPGEKPRIRKTEIFSQIKNLINEQIADLEWQKQHLTDEKKFDEELYDHITQGKSRMDQIRFLLGRTETEENELLDEKITEINTIRRRDYFFVFVTLLIAVLTRYVSWYLFRTGIHERVGRIIKKLKELREKEGGTVDEAGEMETLEAEIEYFLRKYETESEKT